MEEILFHQKFESKSKANKINFASHNLQSLTCNLFYFLQTRKYVLKKNRIILTYIFSPIFSFHHTIIIFQAWI